MKEYILCRYDENGDLHYFFKGIDSSWYYNKLIYFNKYDEFYYLSYEECFDFLGTPIHKNEIINLNMNELQDYIFKKISEYELLKEII